MVTKKIAMTSFADFVLGTDNKRARILRGYKYPGDEGLAMARYYGPVKSAISEFHSEKRESSWLLSRAADFQKSAMTPSGPLKTKFLNNARAIKSYAKYFSNCNYEILPNIKLPFNIGGVTINVTPDMKVMDESKERILKFSFTEKKLKHEYIRVIVACMSYGLKVNYGIDDTDAVALIDVPRGVVHSGLKITGAIVEELSTSCHELVLTWDSL